MNSARSFSHIGTANIFYAVSKILLAFFIFIFLAIASTPHAKAASISDCQGFGGKKFCTEPDINPVRGKYIANLDDACRAIGVVGGIANNGHSTYEIVAETGSQANPTWNSTLTLPRDGINNCTNLSFNSHGFFPALFYNYVLCSTGTLVASGAIFMCAPDAVTQEKNLGKNCCSVLTGNPINNGTGIKFQEETDYQSPSGLSFVRSYNSSLVVNSAPSFPYDLGLNWRHSFKRVVGISSLTPNVAKAYRPDGRAIGFGNDSPNSSTSSWIPDADVTDSLRRISGATGDTTGWEYRRATDGAVESYDMSGRVILIKLRNGQTQTFTYSDGSTPVMVAPVAGLLIRVTDNFGRALNLQYDAQGRMIKMIDPAGGEYLYGYDEASSIVLASNPISNNLTSVTYPGGGKRIYWYNEQDKTANTNIPYALTGITDENGVRFASYFYDSSKRAVSTEHAGAVEKYSIKYDNQYVQSTITDPLGTERIHSLKITVQVVKGGGQSQISADGSGAKAITYDANGNIASRTDFNGNVSTYGYDLTRNLETSRVDPSGTPQARTITTIWHATYSLPLQIAEPKLLTTYIYDTSGNLLNKTVQATSDATGAQGLSPTLVGTARTWSYTYNNVGQVLTATGPRTDVADKTIYTYDNSGNLSTITNAVGQVTTLSNYDANGRVGLITDANGATTALTYSPRGWLTGKTVTSGGTVETTIYGYDGVGQLTLVTLPNASTVSYTYDPAHRLTNITDSLGNSIAYTLDNMGNRISEQVKDPSGALARQTSRVVDALNRIQQITGAVQ
jgi:YD repeat-containing protein